MSCTGCSKKRSVTTAKKLDGISRPVLVEQRRGVASAGRHGVVPDLGTAALIGSWASSNSNPCCRVRSSGMRRKSLALVTESTRLVINSNRLLVQWNANVVIAHWSCHTTSCSSKKLPPREMRSKMPQPKSISRCSLASIRTQRAASRDRSAPPLPTLATPAILWNVDERPGWGGMSPK